MKEGNCNEENELYDMRVQWISRVHIASTLLSLLEKTILHFLALPSSMG